MVAATLANINRNAKKRPKPFTPQDFMAQWGGATAPSDKLDPKKVGVKLHAAFGDRVVRKAKPANGAARL